MLTQPAITLRSINDPFIRALQGAFSRAASTYGMRRGSQKFGNQYIEDAFVYRIQ